jgi:HEAT repeat protein
MFVNSEDQAIALLKNKQLNYKKREYAIHYISERPTSEGIKALVEALRDPEFGVRWTASTALAQLGSKAFPEILRALADPKTNTVRLREGVIHILHYSSNLAHEPVYKHPQIEPQINIRPGTPVSVRDLLTALMGPAADITSIEVAGRLLSRLENS